MPKIFDTLTASHLLNEQLPENGLKYLTRTILKKEVVEYNDVISEGTHSDKFYKYATEDAINTYDLYKLQSPQIEKQGLHHLAYDIEFPFQRALMHLAINGIRADVGAAKVMRYDVQHLFFEIENELLNIFGGKYKVTITPRSRVTSCKPSINFNSSEQVVPLIEGLGFPIYERSKKEKKKSWNKQSKNRLKGKHYAIDLLIKLGTVEKLLNGFLVPFESFVQRDGRIRPSFHNTVCVTGRLSCSKPNIEQLPKNNNIANIRNLFIADDDMVLIVADYSGQEVRIMAQESGDSNLKGALRKGYDVHLATANEINSLNISALGLTDKTPEHNIAKTKYKKQRDDCKCVVFGTAYGKAQPLSAKILTPDGWTTMGNIKIGDSLFSANGNITKVIGVFPQEVQSIYEVKLKDGSFTKCTGSHLWKVQTVYDKQLNRFRVIKTDKLKTILKKGKNNNCFIEYCNPVSFDKKEQIIHSYIMGIYIGDGYSGSSVVLTIANNDIVKKIKALLPYGYELKYGGRYAYRLKTNRKKDSKTGKFVSNNIYINNIKNYKLKGKRAWEKFIPLQYLYGNIEQRWQLLDGLLDSDGTCNHNSYEYSTTSEQLSNDVMFLVKSLGGRCSKTKRFTKCSNTGKRGRLSYRVFISFPPISQSNSVVSVKYVGKEKSKCIVIEDASGLYITDDFIVTHNSAYGFAKDFGCSEKEAQAFIDKFFTQYPGLRRAIEKTREQVYKHRFVTNMSGRKRRFPDFHKLNKWGKERCYRQAFNFKIQSFAADAIKRAAANVIQNDRLRLINIIHDELVIETSKNYAEQGIEYIRRAMIKALPIFIPWDIDINYGERYGQCK